MIKTKLLTRLEIINIWLIQPEILQTNYCCPNCRDLLFKKGSYYVCLNQRCGYFEETINVALIDKEQIILDNIKEYGKGFKRGHKIIGLSTKTKAKIKRVE